MKKAKTKAVKKEENEFVVLPGKVQTPDEKLMTFGEALRKVAKAGKPVKNP